ncbi:MAG: family 16 glycosylhydrolase [Bacteroidales bacterium]|nr:family 16 glycosylhydrolase [Bacteroidales bacterium]
MKLIHILKILLLVLFVNTITNLKAQNYLINFTGSGASSTVTSVRVENLTQGTNLEMNGADVLHLVSVISNIEPVLEHTLSKIRFYPNPMKSYSRMEFDLLLSGMTTVTLYDLCGRNIAQTSDMLTEGRHIYRIQDISEGIYFARAICGKYSTGSIFISYGSQGDNTKIVYESTKDPENKMILPEKESDAKGINLETVMQYNAGDRLKFTGISGNYSTVVVDVPTESKTIQFYFIQCTDGDGNNYPVVKIGTQVWMAENLKTTKYNENAEIQLVINNSEWTTLQNPGYCWYNNEGALNKNIYGGLYNWYAVNSRKICPLGWHVPSDLEWTTLIEYLGEQTAGGKLKETGNGHWSNQNTGATNETGFTALPGGHRLNYDGSFSNIRDFGYWWSTTESSTQGALARTMGYYYTDLSQGNYPKEFGFSVRCIKDDQKIAEAFPGVNGDTVSLIIAGDTLLCDLINGLYIFQGDIILDESQVKDTIGSKGSGLASITHRWTNNTVFYKISDNLPDKARINRAIMEFDHYTNLRFIERTDETNYVEFVRSLSVNEMHSRLGMIGGRQEIVLPDWAETHDVLHELGHTIGLIHEHSRSDRDEYLDIFWENIKQSWRRQFRFKRQKTTYINTLDYNSIMIYPSKSSASKLDEFGYRLDCMLIKNDGKYVYQNYSLSPKDIEYINYLYSTQSPISDFTCTKTFAFVDDSIQFIDQSINGPILKWYWDFGDGNYSLEQNPKHTYKSSGIYSVRLKVVNSSSFNENTKTDFITINDKPYLGGEVQSINSFKYGRFEAKLKPAKKSGVISSFFTYKKDNDSQQEIDIEFVGDSVQFTYHYPGETKETKNKHFSTLINDDDSLYRFDWTPEYIEWYINNTLYYKVTDDDIGSNISSLTDEQYIMMNIWTNKYDWGGILNPYNLPDSICYEWVKVYPWDELSGFSKDYTFFNFSDETELTNWIITDKGSFPENNAEFVIYNVKQRFIDNKGFLALKLSNRFQQGELSTVSDIEGNIYNTIKIGSQWWMAENLKTTKDNNGTSIPLVTDNNEWGNISTPGYCCYNNDATTYKETYGALYNWYALNTGKICPTGWHVPTDGEWKIMEDYLITNGYNYDNTTTSNKIAKALSSTELWASSTNPGAVGNTDYPEKRNVISFSALPGGSRSNTSGYFSNIGYAGFFWSATDGSTTEAWYRKVNYDNSDVYRFSTHKKTGLSIRCIKDSNSPPALPIIITLPVSQIKSSWAIAGGKITYDGGTVIMSSGICWSNNKNPTIFDNITLNDSGLVSFTEFITPLYANTLYYLRAFATNNVGTSYGDELCFRTSVSPIILFNPNLSYGNVFDIEGNIYKTIQIGNQTWMAENLRTTKFNDGKLIPMITNDLDWSNHYTSGYCWYYNDEATYKNIYGALYNGYAVSNGNLCPTGWHIPSDEEWTTLTDYLVPYYYAGGKLKEADNIHWYPPNLSTNESGFTALPGGCRSFDGEFEYLGYIGYWWSSSYNVYSDSYRIRELIHYSQDVLRMGYPLLNGLSVRCIKDN